MIWAQVDPATASALYSPTISLGAAHDIRERGAAHERELLATVSAYRLRAVSVHGIAVVGPTRLGVASDTDDSELTHHRSPGASGCTGHGPNPMP